MRKLLVLFASLALFSSAADIPRQAPELTIPVVGGKQVQLSELRGKVVIVAFILTT